MSWKLKPWIPYGRGSKNHTSARIRFFTVSAPIWEPFCSPKRTKDPVLAHLGALGSEFSISVASTFSRCFLRCYPGLLFHEKAFKREGARERGRTSYIVLPPPSHTLPPCCAIDRTSRAFRNLYASNDRKAWQHSFLILPILI